MSLECANQNTNEEDTETSDLVYMHMHMKNNANINNKKHINENFLMIPSEMLIQEEVKDCASFGGAASLLWSLYWTWSRCSIS